MKVEEVFMVIIGILSLIIFYKIYNGSLVEGAEDGVKCMAGCDPKDKTQLCPGGITCPPDGCCDKLTPPGPPPTPSEKEKCLGQLNELCPFTNKETCDMCATSHQHHLRDAGCDSNVVDYYCNKNPTPPGPTPPGPTPPGPKPTPTPPPGPPTPPTSPTSLYQLVDNEGYLSMVFNNIIYYLNWTGAYRSLDKDRKWACWSKTKDNPVKLIKNGDTTYSLVMNIHNTTYYLDWTSGYKVSGDNWKWGSWSKTKGSHLRVIEARGSSVKYYLQTEESVIPGQIDSYLSYTNDIGDGTGNKLSDRLYAGWSKDPENLEANPQSGCDSSPCGDHGSCAAKGGGGYKCTCELGWGGIQCKKQKECGAILPLNHGWGKDGTGKCENVETAEQCNVSWTGASSAWQTGGHKSCKWSLEKDQCEQTTISCHPHTNSATSEFCALSPNDQWAACNKLTDVTSCKKYGDGCKWTDAHAFGWGKGRNNYPGCIVNCNGCNIRKDLNSTDCWKEDSEWGCNTNYIVPGSGNTKLCIWDPFHGRCLPGYEYDSEDHDRFCTRQRFIPDCDHKDDDGFCYTTGNI